MKCTSYIEILKHHCIYCNKISLLTILTPSVWIYVVWTPLFEISSGIFQVEEFQKNLNLPQLKFRSTKNQVAHVECWIGQIQDEKFKESQNTSKTHHEYNIMSHILLLYLSISTFTCW